MKTPFKKKEKHQLNTMTSNLPAGLALGCFNEGHWFPAFAPLTEAPECVVLLDIIDIPPALTPLCDPGKGYPCRHEAVEACWAWYEAAILPVEWRILTTQIEIYPERNAWYQEEIACLIGATPTLQSIGEEIIALVFNERYGVFAAIGFSPDEAIETLYQCIAACVSYHQQERPQQRAS